MLELCLQDYRLMIIDGGFLCHAAVCHSPPPNSGALRMNRKHYAKILNKLKNRYGDKPRCKLK